MTSDQSIRLDAQLNGMSSIGLKLFANRVTERKARMSKEDYKLILTKIKNHLRIINIRK